MPVIKLTTKIYAPIERVFDLSRSIDLHRDSNKITEETAIAGVTSGLIAKGETVTWKAKHFGIIQTLTSEITEVDFPFLFEDKMVRGAFKSIRHKHLFEEVDGATVMNDVFEFESPLGILGKLFNILVLTKHMKTFLLLRNKKLKEVAESEEWKNYLTQ
jgi:ligand-binding SRPBCC domain-containing protein